VIVIDTHVLLWWVSGESERLSTTAREVLETERREGSIFVSSATAWEIAVLVARKRIGLTTDVLGWLDTVSKVGAITFVPIDNEIAVKSTQLGDDFHKDPGDRYIVATSQKLAAPLVTADEKIRRFPGIRTIW
jgi:PIN domain nuclease of toxin-antitoxin system